MSPTQRPASNSDARKRAEAKQADAWEEGALWAAVECGAITDDSVPWLVPGDNPYRSSP